MITIDNKTYRNLQEQVQKNKEDIAAFKSVDQILIDFGIKVLGQAGSAEQIPEGQYEYGDAYLVGAEDPYDIYIYTRGEVPGFVNLGPLAVKGPQGPEGIQGPQGEQGQRGSTIYSDVGSPTDHNYAAVEGDIYIRTDDASPNNHTAGYIYQYSGDDWHYKTTLRGPQGIQGPAGPNGPRGYTGNVGPQGPAGDPGQSFLIQATLNDPSLLPNPEETQRNHAYVVKTSNYNRLYFIEGDNTLVWNYVDMGNVGSIVTENGQAVQEYNADKAQLRAVQFYNPNLVFKDDELGGYAVVGGGYIETIDGQYSYSLDDTAMVLPLDDTNEITWSADQSGTKLQAHLADAVTNKLDSALVVPQTAPTKTKLVGVDTSNAETLIDADSYIAKNSNTEQSITGSTSGGEVLSIDDTGSASYTWLRFKGGGTNTGKYGVSKSDGKPRYWNNKEAIGYDIITDANNIPKYTSPILKPGVEMANATGTIRTSHYEVRVSPDKTVCMVSGRFNIENFHRTGSGSGISITLPIKSNFGSGYDVSRIMAFRTNSVSENATIHSIVPMYVTTIAGSKKIRISFQESYANPADGTYQIVLPQTIIRI